MISYFKTRIGLRLHLFNLHCILKVCANPSLICMLLFILIVGGCDDQYPEPDKGENSCAGNRYNQYALQTQYGNLLWSPVGDSIIYYRVPVKDIYWDPRGGAYRYVIDTLHTGIYSRQMINDSLEIMLMPSDFGSLEDWSHDGRWLLVYPNGGFWKMHPDGSEKQLLLPVPYGTGFPQFSPDDKKISYSKLGVFSLMNSDGSNAHQLIIGDNPQWLPDFTLIIQRMVGYYEPGRPGVSLWHVDTLGNILDSIGYFSDMYLFTVSPNGKYIAYEGTATHNNAYNWASGNMWVMNIDGTNRRLLDEENFLGDYCWSRNSDAIVFQKFHYCKFTKENGMLWITDLWGKKKQITFPN